MTKGSALPDATLNSWMGIIISFVMIQIEHLTSVTWHHAWFKVEIVVFSMKHVVFVFHCALVKHP